MLAARGPSVTRFPWGSSRATCRQRPDAPQSTFAGTNPPCDPSHDPLKVFAVGAHPAGASPVGVEDVLLAPGELVAVSTDALISGCAPPFAACVAHGLLGGAIDGFEPIPAGKNIAHHAYAFRCVSN
jgi:hypothetical protein